MAVCLSRSRYGLREEMLFCFFSCFALPIMYIWYRYLVQSAQNRNSKLEITTTKSKNQKPKNKKQTKSNKQTNKSDGCSKKPLRPKRLFRCLGHSLPQGKQNGFQPLHVRAASLGKARVSLQGITDWIER